MYYTFEFEDVDGVSANDRVYPEPGEGDGGSNTITLNGAGAAAFTVDEGTYFITINAYKDPAGTLLIATKTEKNTSNAGYEVKSGAPVSFSSTLTAGLSAGSGTFTYSITPPGTPSYSNTPPAKFVKGAQTLTVYTYPYTFGDTPKLSKDLTVPANCVDTTGTSLPVGAYVVRVESEMDFCQDVVVTEVMHIYNNLTTHFPGSEAGAVTVPNHKQNKFTVKFDMNEKTVSNEAAFPDQYIDNAGLVDEPLVIPLNDTDSEVFVGWFDAAGGTTNFSFATKKIYTDNVKVFAHWGDLSGQGVGTITIAFTQPSVSADLQYTIKDDSDNPVLSTYPLSLQDFENGYTVEIELTGADVGSVWSLGNGRNVTPSGDTLTIDKGTVWLSELVGTSYIYVTGEDDPGNVPFAAVVIINITP